MKTTVDYVKSINNQIRSQNNIKMIKVLLSTIILLKKDNNTINVHLSINISDS